MTDHKVFVDSNIVVYLIDDRTKEKTEKVQNIISPDFLISTQVVSENVNVCLKKLKLSKQTAFNFARKIINRFKLVQITEEILIKSFDISTNYQLSTWDSIIIATALSNNCTILYSEDMQDGLVIENQLTIRNPFKN